MRCGRRLPRKVPARPPASTVSALISVPETAAKRANPISLAARPARGHCERLLHRGHIARAGGQLSERDRAHAARAVLAYFPFADGLLARAEPPGELVLGQPEELPQRTDLTRAPLSRRGRRIDRKSVV